MLKAFDFLAGIVFDVCFEQFKCIKDLTLLCHIKCSLHFVIHKHFLLASVGLVTTDMHWPMYITENFSEYFSYPISYIRERCPMLFSS